MKKIMTLFAAAVLAGAAWAHQQARVMPINRALPEKQAVSVQPNFEAAVQQAPACTMGMASEVAKTYAAKEYNTLPSKARKAAMDTKPLAGYLAPEGSYFCGIDKMGSYMWVNIPVVIGSWMNGNETWVWSNIAQDATEYEYQNALGIYNPKYSADGNTVDADYNWIDTVAATSKGNYKLFSSYREPLQIVSNGVEKDSFAINQPYSGRLDTLVSETMTLGGIKNFMEDDGMWPLTKAMFFDLDYGFTLRSFWGVDSTTMTPMYIIGSSKVKTTQKGSQGQDSLVTYVPASLVQFYEKPMSPLYVHDISIAINAYEYYAPQDTFINVNPKFDSLELIITDTTGKKLLYAGIATINDTTNMLYIPGALVNFKIVKEDEFGEKTYGMTIDQPYIVWLYGLDRPGNNFGIYTGMNMLTGGSTYVGDSISEKFVRYYPCDPFIMFNGIMNTLEDGHVMMGYESVGDTVDVTLEMEGSEYILVYAEGDMEGYVPVIAATDLLYDTVSMYYNYEIDAPDWANFDMEIYVDETTGYDYWEDFGIYFLYIWGNTSEKAEKGYPVEGDIITFSQYGKKIIFRVVGVPAGLNEIKYINDGKRYDVLGKEVDENYKGVVIMNGKKMLQ